MFTDEELEIIERCLNYTLTDLDGDYTLGIDCDDLEQLLEKVRKM